MHGTSLGTDFQQCLREDNPYSRRDKAIFCKCQTMIVHIASRCGVARMRAVARLLGARSSGFLTDVAVKAPPLGVVVLIEILVELLVELLF
jgi:hypothetical protein